MKSYELLDILKKKEDQNGYDIFELMLTDHEMKQLKVGDEIDHRDCEGQYYRARITEINKNRNKVKIHYLGFENRWDCWISTRNRSSSIVYAGKISGRDVKSQCLKNVNKNSIVWVNSCCYDMQSDEFEHNIKWIKGVVIRRKGKQVYLSGPGMRIRNKTTNKRWIHLDNRMEIIV